MAAMILPASIPALPCWTGPVTATRLPGGLSNEIWKVSDAAGDHVLRLGRDYPFHHVNRAREVMVSGAAHAAGFAPDVEYAAPGIMVTAFVAARTLTAADLRDDPARIADLLRRFHTAMPAHISGDPPLFWVFHVIRDYARTLSDAGEPVDPALLAQARTWEEMQVPLPLIFGHNDLLPANLLDDGTRLWLIDFEYAGFSTALFDLASVASHSAMTDPQCNTLLTRYFGPPPEAALLRAFAAMQCAALLREALWARVSLVHLAAPGVDYAAYAAENFARLSVQSDALRARYG